MLRKMFCWNCKKIGKTNEVETEILSQISEVEGPQKITYCSECDAILKPISEKITCFRCGEKNTAFFWTQGVLVHGPVDVPLCKKCRVELGGK